MIAAPSLLANANVRPGFFPLCPAHGLFSESKSKSKTKKEEPPADAPAAHPNLPRHF